MEKNDLDIAVSRRELLRAAGAGLAAANLTGALSVGAGAQTPAQNSPASATPPGQKPIQLSLIEAPTEKQSPGPPNAAPPERRVGWAIVGLGHLALEEILPAFGMCKMSKPVALVSGDRDKANQVASQYGVHPKNVYDYKNYDSLRDNPDVDIIYIVLPNGMHAEYTVRGAQAGKHILCEKPMANSVKECQQMIDACKKANKKLMVAYRMQYEPYNREMIRMVRSRELGLTKLIVADNGQNQGDPEQWRLKKAMAGGGALPDVGIYCLNATRYLTGEEPTEISATQYSTPGDPRFREVEETVSFQLRYPSGVVAACTTSYGHHENRSYKVLSERGWASLDPAFPYRGLRMHVAHASGPVEFVEERRLNEKNQFASEMDHLSQCVMQDKPPHTPGEEGLQDMRLIAAIYDSARTGRVVKLPATPGLDVTRGPEPQMA